MKLTESQYERIRPLMPRRRGNVRLSNVNLLSAVLYVAENGCKWRALPKEFGNWNTIYVRLSRWAKSEVPDRAYEGDKTRELAEDLGYIPVVPPKSNRLEPYG